MRKIYLLVFLLVTTLLVPAQVSLPYAYDFSDPDSQGGFTFTTNDENCGNSDGFFSGQQADALYFVSGLDFCGMDYRQYLLSPRFENFTGDSVQLSFRYIVADEQPSTETFVIGYCNADTYTSEDDFVWLEDTVVCTNYESWLSYQHNVPATAQYVAIAYISGEQYALVIDDWLLRIDTPEGLYTFTVNANGGGSVSVTTGGTTTYGTTTVQEGAELSYTVTAALGYYIGAFFLDNVPNSEAVGQTSFSQTLYPVIADHVLDVTFERYTYHVQIVETEHGQIVPDGGDSHELIVPWDTTIGFRFYPDEGYHTSRIALTTGSTTTYIDDPVDTFTLANIRKNYTLQVSFALNNYVVTVSAGEGGTISPSGEVNVEGWSSPEFLIAADPGYVIDTIYVDGVPSMFPHSETYVYRFEDVVADHTLSATFRLQAYIVHYTCGPHGTVTAQGGEIVGLDSIRIYYEDTIVFNFAIEEGYELSTLQLNDVSLEVANPYLLTHVAQNSLFHATFAEKTFQVSTIVHGYGSVSPQQSGNVGYFDTVRFVMTPSYCMATDSILLDGSLLSLSDTLMLTHLEGTHTLEAYFGQKIYAMEILPCEHGAIVGSSEVPCSHSTTLNIVPDPCYRFTHFYMDGEERDDLVRLIYDTMRTTISSVYADHAVYAEFERIIYELTVSSTGAGTVTPGTAGSVPCDTTLVFEVVPDECHYVASVTVNGESAESIIQRYPCAESGFGDTVRFALEHIGRSQSVSVEFEQYDFPLTLTAGEHGLLSETGTLQLPCGTDKTITITPDACYEIATVRVDDEDVTASLDYSGTTATFTFSDVHEGHSLEATFARQTYTVSVLPTTNGSVTPSGDSAVLCGNDLTYVIVPDHCYKIDSVWLDGVPVNSRLEMRHSTDELVGDSAILVLAGITEDHIVRAAFKPIRYFMRAAAFGSADGSVSFSEPGEFVNCGATVTLTMTPNDCYYLDEVYYNSYLTTDYTIDGNGVGRMTFEDVSDNVYVSVFFEKYRYELSLAQPTQHGSIDFGPSVHDCGSSVRLVYQADDCYHLDSVMVDNVWMPVSSLEQEGSAYVYVIPYLHSDLLLDAAFSIDSVHFVADGGFPLSVMDSVLACGQDLFVLSVREDCKQLDSIRLNGTLYTPDDIDGHLMSLSGDTLLVRFENIHEDCSLGVFYSHIRYELLVDVQGEGHVSQPPYQIVDCGDSLAIAITPDDCQHFEKVTINDSIWQMDNDTLLTISDMRSNLRMVFYFSPDMYAVTAQSNALGEIVGDTGQIVCGTDLQYVFAPSDCAMLDSVFLDGACVNDLLVSTPAPTLLIDSISSNHHIQALFKLIPYQIVVETDSFSFVDVEPVNVVECGSDFAIRITPDHCHYISDILLDSLSVISELDEETHQLQLSNVTQNHRLVIVFAKYSYHIVTTMVDSSGQVLATEGSVIICGRDTTIHIVAYNDCYKIDSVYVNDTLVELQTSYTLSSVAEDVSLTVFMHKMEYVVKVLESEHFIMVEGEFWQTVHCGDTLHLEFAPEEGYYLSGLVLDEDTLPASDYLVLEDIHDNHEVWVLTELYHYTVITTTGEGGLAIPDTMAAGYGSDVIINIVLDDCYEIQSLLVDSTNYLDSLQYFGNDVKLTIHSLTSDKAVTVEFARIEYTFNAISGEGGVVTPSYVTVPCGDSLHIAIIPDACYHVTSVTVNDYWDIPLEEFQQIGSELHAVGKLWMNYDMEVQFAKDTFSVIVDNHGEGTVVTTSDQVVCGEEYSFYIAPEPCTRIQSVLLNGEDITDYLGYRPNVNPWLSDTAYFTVANVTADQIIKILYENEEDRHIDVSFMAGSNVLQHESVAVACGGDTVLPLSLDCYAPDSVFVDGVVVPTNDSCRFTEVITDHTVLVMLSRTQYQIAAESTLHGTLTPSGTSDVDCGTDKTYSIAPELGYYIDSLIVDDTVVPSVSSYTFTDVRQNHTIRAVFAQHSYLVDVEVSGNGIVTPGDTTVTYGGAAHFDILPDECHSTDSVVVDGVNYGSVTEFDFASVTEAHTIHGYFSRMQYTVETGVSDNGTVTFGSSEVACGDTVVFTVVPNDCYKLDSVLVNGENVGAVSAYTIRDVRQNHVVDAFFSPIAYQIVMTDMQHGTVTAESDQVLCGGNVNLTIQPDDCYSVDSVLVNGANVGAVTTYTISNIVEDQMVSAFFSINEYGVEVTAGDHGTVTNMGENRVTCGESFAITLTPDNCYDIGAILVDGIDASGQLQDNLLTLENVTENHQISVTFEMHRYDQHVAFNNVGGTVEPDFVAAACGGDVTYTIRPIACYRIDTVWINDAVLPVDSLTFNENDATFTMYDIRQTNDIRVRFTSISYQFEVENNGDGLVHLEQNSVDCNGAATFYILPAQCDRISSALLNDADITDAFTIHPNANPLMPDTSFYTIASMDADQLLRIDYERLPDNHVSIAYTDGTTELYAADSVLACGSELSLSIGYDCYTVDSVLVDGENVGAVTSLSLASNLTDQTVRAFLSQNHYMVETEVSDGGEIVFDGGSEVACGGNVSCTIIPNVCYSIDSVVVNGTNQGIITSFVFENIIENQNIKAYFSQNRYAIAIRTEGNGQITLDGSDTVLCGESRTCEITSAACATLDSVVVNGLNEGVITHYSFENIAENQGIIAYFSQNEYQFEAIAEDGGRIEPAGTTTVACGEQQTYTILPDDCYDIDSVVVNGTNRGQITTCTLQCTDAAGNQTIHAFFSKRTYLVTLTAGEGGSIIPANDTLVPCGDNLMVSITPDDCYDITSVVVDGIDRGAVSSYTIENVTEEHTVSVTFGRKAFDLTPLASAGGTITPNVTATVACGSDYTFDFEPNTGYSITAVIVDGDTMEADDHYTFENVTDNHTVKPVFARNRYMITAAAGEGGTVSPDTSLVEYLGRQTISITAADCYHIDSVFADGSYVGAYQNYTFSNVTAPHTLYATFGRDSYEITASSEGEGTITPAGTTMALCGEDVTYVLTPEAGWHIAELRVDGDVVEITDTFTFVSVRDNHTISARFSIDEFTVTATAGDGGLVTPSVAEASFGESVTVRIVADDCHHIDSVFADGVYVGAVPSYTFSDIDSNHSLSATFALNEYTVEVVTPEHGRVTLDTDRVVCGNAVNLTVVPDTCYHIDSVVVNGTNVGAVTSYQIENIHTDQTVVAYFSLDLYMVEVVANEGGVVTLEGSNSVACGGSVGFSVTPDTCFSTDSVVVNGVNLGAIASYVIENITMDQTVAAFFSRNVHEVTAVAATGGNITPEGISELVCGSAITYHIAPNACHQIDSVVVNGVNLGAVSTCTVTGTDELGDQMVNAYFSARTYQLSLSADEGGHVTPTGDTMVVCGSDLNVEIIPDECYNIENVTVDGTVLGALSSYAFENVEEAHTLSATFVLREYMLTPVASDGGTVAPDAATTVSCGSDFTFRFTPDDGYYVSGVVLDGDTLASADTLLLTDITANHTVQPLFALAQFVITATAGEGGSVTPEYAVVDYQGRHTVRITPAECYHIDSVFLDGAYIGNSARYNFTNVVADHTLYATFAVNTYTLSASMDGEGTLTPIGDTVVNCGESVTYMLWPAEGWHLTTLSVDGVSQPHADSYTFENIRGNHAIYARFAINEFEITASAGAGGNVSPSSVDASYGDNVTIEIIPDDCYHVDSVFVDDEYVGPVTSYTFDTVAANHTLYATFAMSEYMIVVLPVPQHGTITPSSMTPVNCGDSLRYSILPEEGYHVSELIVDGVSMDAAETYLFDDVRGNHRISAQFALNEYTVTATAGEGGIVTPADTIVNYGDSVTVAITAADCYHIDSVFADGVYVGAVGSYTFRDVVADHTLAATFAIDTYTVTASVEGEGTIAPEGATTVDCGGSLGYSFVPATGWHLTEVRVDDEPVEATDSYTFTDVRANHTITVSFALNEYTVTATAGEGGIVTPADTIVNYGDSVTVAITAADCYHIDSVFADGVYVGAVGSYTFRDVVADHTLAATFAIDTYTVTASVEGEGTIAPEGATTVDCGGSLGYSFAPATGWHLTEVRVDDEPVEATDSYTFTDVRSNHTITVSFALNEYTVAATAGEGGIVTPTDTTVNYGDSVTVAITAADCYHIDSVFADGVYVGAVGSYTFRDIDADHTLTATFMQNVYEIRISAISEDNVVLYDTLVDVLCGTDMVANIPLFYCYHVDSIDVNGAMNYEEDSVLVQNVREDMDVIFYLSREQFVLTASKQGNGTVSPMDTVHAACDDAITFRFTPDQGWYVEQVIVDGASIGAPAGDSITFYNIHDNHTIEVIFAPTVFIITSSIDPTDAGHITPYGQTAVTYGADQTFNIEPFPGYEVIDVEVDGVSQGAITTYTFHNVTANHTIVAHLQVVGVEEFTSEEVNVWPNPVENVCHIQLSDIHNTEIQLFDAQGKLLLRKHAEADEVEIDLSQRPSGMYLLRIVSDSNIVTTKKVIRK